MISKNRLGELGKRHRSQFQLAQTDQGQEEPKARSEERVHQARHRDSEEDEEGSKSGADSRFLGLDLDHDLEFDLGNSKV